MTGISSLQKQIIEIIKSHDKFIDGIRIPSDGVFVAELMVKTMLHDQDAMRDQLLALVRDGLIEIRGAILNKKDMLASQISLTEQGHLINVYAP